ncbi:MAG: hypothetical protein AAF721_14685 [Myxococcota bacterium]
MSCSVPSRSGGRRLLLLIGLASCTSAAGDTDGCTEQRAPVTDKAAARAIADQIQARDLTPLRGLDDGACVFFHHQTYESVEGSCGTWLEVGGAIQVGEVAGSRVFPRAVARVFVDENRAELATLPFDLPELEGVGPYKLEMEFELGSDETTAWLFDGTRAEIVTWHQVIAEQE